MNDKKAKEFSLKIFSPMRREHYNLHLKHTSKGWDARYLTEKIVDDEYGSIITRVLSSAEAITLPFGINERFASVWKGINKGLTLDKAKSQLQDLLFSPLM